jgi:hypothetical protein
MPIKITCPHCKRGMLVDERMAGKKGKCKACQQILTVPPLPTSGSAAREAVKPDTPAPARPVKPVDVEAEAAALFSDEPKPARNVEVKTIDFECHFCDEPIKLPADLAGKRAPCPACKRILKVPELVKKDPKDWRKVEARGPTGAVPTNQPELEGAWGSTSIRGVGRQSLMEAGVIPKEEEKPRTLWQKFRWPVLGVSLLIVLGTGGLLGYSWWARRAVERGVQEAVAFADSAETTPDVKAALLLAAGEYYLNSRTKVPDPRTGSSDFPAAVANKQLGTAFTTLSSLNGEERDALLGDLALAQVESGGDKVEEDEGRRQSWDNVQKRVVATLGKISDPDARLETLRAVVHRLRASGQVARVMPLTNQTYSVADADKAAALSVVGLEFLKADDRQSAEIAADAALQPPAQTQKKDKPLPLRAEVVALALLLEKKNLPAAGDKGEDKANQHVGKVEALARQGKWDEARKKASVDEFGETVRFRARLAVAVAAVDAKVPDTEFIESALKTAESLSKQAELSWSLLRLTQLALRTSLPEDRVQGLADTIGNPALRGRAQLAVFRARLEKSKQTVEDSTADKIDAKSLARSLAALSLARHNTRLDPNYAGVVQTWPQPLKSFGSLGIALGLQDREKQ